MMKTDASTSTQSLSREQIKREGAHAKLNIASNALERIRVAISLFDEPALALCERACQITPKRQAKLILFSAKNFNKTDNIAKKRKKIQDA